MRPLVTRREAADHDRAAISRGISGLVLMENAARGAADAIQGHFGSQAAFPGHAALSRPLVLGGTGNNGGDGWAVARQLLTRGGQPRAVLSGDPARVLSDARTNRDALVALGVPVEPVPTSDEALRALLRSSTLVIDALFGTGLDREITGDARRLIEIANECARPMVALDLPSGICADTGRVLGVAIRAQLTVTFGAHKRGLHQHPGAQHAGSLVLADIGVPAPSSLGALLGAEDISLVARAIDAHKGTAGRVLVIAGSPGRTGAALLAGLGAMRVGAGLVTLAARGGAARAALDAKVVEMMTAEIPEALEAGVQAALREAAERDAVVLGPGVGTDASARSFLERTAIEMSVPAVLDADALTAFAGNARALASAVAPRVLTPHPGEAALLLGTDVPSIQADRYGAALALAAASGAIVILKGARTIIADPRGKLAVSTAGTPALASGGTGDVLSGVVAGCLVHSAPFDAAITAVLLHALAGERAAVADRGVLAHEVADAIPMIIRDALAMKRG